jgi:tripartite-type tricarboxylate transporter receptor subunit TctC
LDTISALAILAEVNKRRSLFEMTLAVLAVSSCASFAYAQSFPSKPIRLLVGSPPGGGADFIARALSQKLSESLGQSVIVENRPGANGAIASELLARSAPDGHTLIVNIIGHSINPSVMKLNFDSINDFAFVSQVAASQNLLVAHPSFPATTVKALIALSKAKPGEITYGSQGIGASGHLSGELFQLMTGVKWVHVPYKGGAPAMSDLMAGQISLSFGNIPTLVQQVRAGKLRAIAVTGAQRTAAAPDIPTVAESGVPGFEVSNWFGVSAPARTPAAIVDRVYTDIVHALKSPEVRAAFNNAGAEPVGSNPEQYSAFIRNESAKWAKVIKAAGIKGE